MVRIVRLPVESTISKWVNRYTSQEVCPYNIKFASELPEGSPFASRAAIAGKDARTRGLGAGSNAGLLDASCPRCGDSLLPTLEWNCSSHGESPYCNVAVMTMTPIQTTGSTRWC